MITAIIVNYNSGALLTACVASLLASTCEVKVVVSDNASSDDSLDRLQAFFGEDRRIAVLRNGENLGFSRGCNRALTQVAGEYVLFINPDCVVPPEALEKMSRLMVEHPQAGMAGCLIRNLDGSEQVGCRRYIPTPWRALMRVLSLDRFFPRVPLFQTFNLVGTAMPSQAIVIEAISGAFMFVRRSALEQLGQLDEHYFLHCEDLDWCMRMRLAGYDILFEPRVEITHLKGGSLASAFFVEWHKHKGMTRFYLRFFRRQYPLLLMLVVIVSVWLRFFLLAPYLLLKRGSGVHPDARLACGQYVRLRRNFSLEAAARTVIVSGATSQIGCFLLPRLVQAGYRVVALSRSLPPQATRDPSGRVHWIATDIRDLDLLVTLPPARYLIHLAPLFILPPSMKAFADVGVTRLIAFSSSSRYSKAESAVVAERDYAASLAAAERDLAACCAEKRVHSTIFRPTLIYGRGMDRNVALIRRVIRLVGVFPLLGEGKGLRQPVHADDLASACVAALENASTYEKSYDLSGGETLAYRSMVARIFDSLGRKPRFLAVPSALFGGAMRMLSLLPRYRDFNVAMARRMDEDLVYDHGQAHRDFGYVPQRFRP